MKYSFVNPIKGIETTEDGTVASLGYSDEELEAKVDAMTDPTRDQEPQPGDERGIYPPVCGDDPELKRQYERDFIDLGTELPPLRLLPKDSLFRTEWFRRAEILKKEREEWRMREAAGLIPEEKPLSKKRELELLEDFLHRGGATEDKLRQELEGRIREIKQEIKMRRVTRL